MHFVLDGGAHAPNTNVTQADDSASRAPERTMPPNTKAPNCRSYNNNTHTKGVRARTVPRAKPCHPSSPHRVHAGKAHDTGALAKCDWHTTHRGTHVQAAALVQDLASVQLEPVLAGAEAQLTQGQVKG